MSKILTVDKKCLYLIQIHKESFILASRQEKPFLSSKIILHIISANKKGELESSPFS